MFHVLWNVCVNRFKVFTVVLEALISSILSNFGT